MNRLDASLPSATVTRRSRVGERRSREVLDATWKLITEVGFGRVRIADVAERVGTSTGTIHYHFATKDELLDAAFRFAVEESRHRSEAALAGLSDPWEQIVAVVDAHLPEGDGLREWRIWLQMWSEASFRQELRSLNEANYGRWIDRVEDIVREGQRRGVFRALEARDFVVQLLTMMDGLVIQVLMGSGEVDIARLRSLLLGFARAQLLPPDASPQATGAPAISGMAERSSRV